MGSELIRRGINLPSNIWSAYANTAHPNIVYNIHRDNINAGTTLITANTFRTTPRSYVKTGISLFDAEQIAHESMIAAINIAKKAANNNVKVLGSIAPLEDCYKPEAFPGSNSAINEFYMLGLWIKNSHADGIILETMNSISETIAALEAIYSLSLPIYVSFYLADELHLASGELLQSALDAIINYNIEAVLLNCIPVNIMERAVDNIVNIYKGKWGIYPNLGIGSPSAYGDIKKRFSDKQFLYIMKKAVDKGANILGGCCGSSSHHISLINNNIINNLS